MSEADLGKLVGGMRSALLQLHKKLIDWAREEYAREVAVIDNPYRFLSLLTSDPWFEWLRPLSEIIVRIDEIEAKPPIETAAAIEVREAVLAVFDDDSERRGFVRRLSDAMHADPGLASDEAMIRMLAERLPKG